MKISVSELELTVVGTTLANNAFYQKANVTTEMFLDPVYKKIWSIISKLIQSGEPVDAFTVMDELGSTNLRETLMNALSGSWSQAMGESFAIRLRKNHTVVWNCGSVSEPW